MANRRFPTLVKINAPQIVKDMWRTQQMIEALILATPTGEVRNQLTDANIHAMAAHTKMLEAVRLSDEGK